MEEQAFFLEIQRLSMEIDRVIDRYGMRDRALSIMTKLYLNNDEEDYTDEKRYYRDIDDLLDGTGIELE